MSTPHKPMAQVAESFVFFLEKRADGSRWPVGTKLYAESPLIEAAPDLLHELRLLNVDENGEQRRNTPAARAIARATGSAA